MRIQTRSSMPEPRPITLTGSESVRAATSTAATVLEATPSSPGMSRSAPASTSSSAIAMPLRNAVSASARVSASSWSIRPLPRRTLYVRSSSGVVASTERSSSRLLAPTVRASELTAEPPDWASWNIQAVASGGYDETPA